MTDHSDRLYAGDLSPQEAFDLLGKEAAAQLVDVRTNAEWAFVGVVDLSSLAKAPLLVEWQSFPTMAPNAEFAEAVEAQGEKANGGQELAKDQPLVFLCRSGVRSIAAANEMARRGYTRCYNILEGFEGGHDDKRHRGHVNGWKARDLPWMQQ